jgi:hypothetical protein
MYFSLSTDATKQGAMPDAVERDMQGCGEVKETELDVLLQCREEMFGKVEYVTELEAEGNNAMEWSYIELENGEMYAGQNCEEVGGQVLDMIGLEMEWSSVELESGEVCVRQNNYEEVLDMIGNKEDTNYDTKQNNVNLETGEVKKRKRMNRRH